MSELCLFMSDLFFTNLFINLSEQLEQEWKIYSYSEQGESINKDFLFLYLYLYYLCMVFVFFALVFFRQEWKIYSYSEQGESINKDCCNSQTSPGGHSQNQLSAKDFLFLCLHLLYFVLYLYSLHLYFCI